MKSWHHHLILKTAFIVLALTAVDKAQAECPEWTLTSQEVNIGQSNDTELFLNFEQKGRRLGGNAQYRNTSGRLGRGLVSGKIQDSRIVFQITWQDGNRGSYRGEISSKGRLSGIMEDSSNPASGARWSSHNRQAACLTLVATAQRDTQCQPGFARRDLFAGDDACVTPAERLKANHGHSQ